MLKTTDHNTWRNPNISRKINYIIWIKTPNFNKVRILIRGYKYISGKLVRFLLLFTFGVILQDHITLIMKEYMSNLMKDAEPKNISPLPTDGYHEHRLIRTNPECCAVGLCFLEMRTYDKGHSAFSQLIRQIILKFLRRTESHGAKIT